MNIVLANNKGIATIDDCDSDMVPIVGWRLHPSGYAIRTVRRSDGVETTQYLHRLVMNPDPGMAVDHKNHDRLDCRRGNLRLVTCSQNLQNRLGVTKGKRSTCERGVFRKNSGFCVQVKVGGKLLRRYGFKTVPEAAAVARQLRAEFMTHSEECA